MVEKATRAVEMIMKTAGDNNGSGLPRPTEPRMVLTPRSTRAGTQARAATASGTIHASYCQRENHPRRKLYAINAQATVSLITA
jgi:hypothetical protein